MSDPRPVLDVEGPRDHLAPPDPAQPGADSWAGPAARAGEQSYALGAAFGVAEAPRRLRAHADLLDGLDPGPSVQGLRLPREERSDAQVTLTAAQLRLAADLLEHPDFGA